MYKSKPTRLKWDQPPMIPSATDEVPKDRSGHTLSVIGNNAFLFGGLTKTRPSGPNNEMWLCQISSDNFTWSLPELRDGKLPSPRYNHTATVFGKNQILLFGGMKSGRERYNDTWVFDTVAQMWTHLAFLQMTDQCPQPRGGHSACLVDGSGDEPRMYIFGGFGGAGYGRRDLNDLYCLTLPRLATEGTTDGAGAGGVDDMTWHRCAPRGATRRCPEPRSGHSACTVKNTIVVYGGWSSTRQFNDLWVCDLEKTEWTQIMPSTVNLRAAPGSLKGGAGIMAPPDGGNVESKGIGGGGAQARANANGHGPARWGHCAMSVEAIPNWKMFIFGGYAAMPDARPAGVANSSGTRNELTNHLVVLDTGDWSWTQPETLGEPPMARSDSTLAYDTKGSRLCVFGGWANGWLGDMNTLDVGSVVGPPYAIMDMDPKVGPITGGVRCIINGIDFSKAPPVTVRFASRKHFVDVEGEYKNETTLACVLPPFTKYGPGEVQVRVSMRGDSFTTTFQKFRYFAVTHHHNCLAFGPGLCNGAAAGIPVVFHLAAFDTNNDRRTSGGDEFEVWIKDSEEIRVPHTVTDNENGDYLVTYKAPRPGIYKVSVKFMGTYAGPAGPLKTPSWAALSTKDVLQLSEEEEKVVKHPSWTVRFSDSYSKELNRMDGSIHMTFLGNKIKELAAFMDKTVTTLQLDPGRDDVNMIIDIKETLQAVKLRKGSLQLDLDTSHAAIDYLKAFGIAAVPSLQVQLQRASEGWTRALELAQTTRTRIAPMVKACGVQMKVVLAEYEMETNSYAETHRARSYWDYADSVDAAMDMLKAGRAEHVKRKETYKEKLHIATVFEFPELMDDAKNTLAVVAAEMKCLQKVWEFVEVVQTYFEICYANPWAKVNFSGMEVEAKKLQQQSKSLPGEQQQRDVYVRVKKRVREFVKVVPCFRDLGSSAMRPRHWTALQDGIKQRFVPPHRDPGMLLGQIMDLKLHEHFEATLAVTERSRKEEKIELTIKRLGQTWSDVRFEMFSYTAADKSVVKCVKMNEEDLEQLENDQLVVQGMLSSRFHVFFAKDLNKWKMQLEMTMRTVSVLLEVLKAWMYLEPLFAGSEEVRRELPIDTARFHKVDEDTKKVLEIAVRELVVHDVCQKKGLLQTIEAQLALLEQCKKSLGEFLDGKRRIFPRFYFVSEAALLDILANGNDVPAILKHIPKVYLATSTLVLQQQKDFDGVTDITTVMRWRASVGDEELPLEPPLKLTGKVERYLQTLLQAVRKTLRNHLDRSMRRYAKMKRHEWLLDKDDRDGNRCRDAAQISLLVAQVFFCKEIEKAFVDCHRGNKVAVQSYSKRQETQLAHLIKLTRSKLTRGERQRVMCLITLDAHNRDLVSGFVQDQITSALAFQWQAQLKQRFGDEADFADIVRKSRGAAGADETAKLSGPTAVGQCCEASFVYGFEYLGNGGRLVITPLTDRIYVTATQALNLCLGVAPKGPAGTGKTETSKDLAAALGKACYVFNCSPEMDYKSMGAMFKGLAASGSWGCFDEFNRLAPAVLSVCSLQFKAVLDAVRAGAAEVDVEGEGNKVQLDPTTGAFVTMNPGYLGRSSLPESLKVLFRPITVMVPDMALICENMLMAEGFQQAKTLASKFVGLYGLLRRLLSKQAHYDWGLRAVKTVLGVAGAKMRAEPGMKEEELLMRALRDMNLPKIVREDEALFLGLLADLFPGLNPPRKVDAAFEEDVRLACLQRDLWPDQTFMLNVVRLRELVQVRHCNFIMGDPGSGKTELWKTLAKASKMDAEHVLDLNPKSVTTEELYGHVVMSTRDWKDGLLSKSMRNLAAIEGDAPRWLIIDGDLDANWIESMNSVMDDNKTLTLASNERIVLRPCMKLLFEIRDLESATPATVSRAGILFVPSHGGQQWRSILAAWVQARADEDDVKTALSQLLNTYCEYLIELFEKRLVLGVVERNAVSMVTTLLTMLEGLLHPDADNGIYATIIDGNSVDEILPVLEPVFAFCAVWAFGCGCGVSEGKDQRVVFSERWKHKFKEVKFPGRDTVFDYYLDPDTNKMESWKTSPYFYAIDYDSLLTPMSQVTVPTTDTGAITYWMNQLVQRRAPVMLVGGAGVGKTQMVKGLLAPLTADPDEVTQVTISFNYYTSSARLQAQLEQPLQKKKGNRFGPQGEAKLIYFLDDVNLPRVDAYNTQSAVALLRQHLDYGHWFERDKLELREVVDVQYIACLNPTAGSFRVNPRLQRHFTPLAVAFPRQMSLLTIYKTFLDGHLKQFKGDVQAIAGGLINAALGLHTACRQTFRKTAVNFHYEFNIRHLSNVFQGILMARPAQFEEPIKLVKLWLHESQRVYGDRLATADELRTYQSLAQAAVKKRFPQFNMAPYFSTKKADLLLFCHFSRDWANTLSGEFGLVYDQVEKAEALNKTLTDALVDYNDDFPAMQLVLFNDAMFHICRVARVIANPRGHMMLVGVGGSGKQSLAKLAAYCCGQIPRQLAVNGSYSLSDFKEELKDMCTKAGVGQEAQLLVLPPAHIVEEQFLVLINDLLSNGHIPGLFALDEKDAILNDMFVQAKAKFRKATVSSNECWDLFLRQVQTNLHVALCVSPIGDTFRTQAQRFPAITSCTVIDWFQPWPEAALLSVAKRALQPDRVKLDKAHRKGVEEFMPFAFLAVRNLAGEYLRKEKRHVHTTPKSFLLCLDYFVELLDKKRASVSKGLERLGTGLDKLDQTGREVTEIENSLEQLVGEAEAKKQAAEFIAIQVAQDRAVCERATAAADEEREKCEAIQVRVEEKRNEIAAELVKAEPSMLRATAALETLNKHDLGECKTMAKPPDGVDQVFSAVMVLFARVYVKSGLDRQGRVKDKSWKAAKKAMLGNVNVFLEHLHNFRDKIDEGAVPKINMQQAKAYTTMEKFDVDVIRSKNKAAGGLCAWVINIVDYYAIAEFVLPLRKKLDEANAELQEADAKRAKVQAECDELQEKLDKLTAAFEEAVAEKKEAVRALESGKSRLVLARRLTAALHDESDRWTEGSARLNAAQAVLVGDTLLAAAFVSYAGPFEKRYRSMLMNKHFVPFLAGTDEGGPKKGRVPTSVSRAVKPGEKLPPCNPLEILTDESEMTKWAAETLPSDRTSNENGAIVLNTPRWPLLIDPQLQGVHWLRERFKGEALVTLNVERKGALQVLEKSIEDGMVVLLEVDEVISPTLMPLVRRQFVTRGRRQYVTLGDREIEIGETFKLYLHTNLSNPRFAPEVQAECALVNFSVTAEGLEEQLLALVVRKERPDLAEQKARLIVDCNRLKISIRSLEDQILRMLADSEGNATENKELVQSLEETKKSADSVKEKIKGMVDTTATINETADKYRPVAARGSLLFMLINGLYKVSPSYVYSLNAFVVMFIRGMESAKENSDSQKGKGLLGKLRLAAKKVIESLRFKWNTDVLRTARLATKKGAPLPFLAPGQLARPKTLMTDAQIRHHCKKLNAAITDAVFTYLRRGLLDKHQLMAAALLCLKVSLAEGVGLTEALEVMRLDANTVRVAFGPAPVSAATSSSSSGVGGGDDGRPGDEGDDAGVAGMGLLSEWMPARVWERVQLLQGIKGRDGNSPLTMLGENMQSDSDEWMDWYNHPTPEALATLPGGEEMNDSQKVGGLERVAIVRMLRPDRTAAAMSNWVAACLGPQFITKPAFDMSETFNETSSATPIFFVLFPGVDPSRWVLNLAASRGVGVGDDPDIPLVNISLGQGQEAGAMKAVEDCGKTGGWVILQNLHLMGKWVQHLTTKLEEVVETAHVDFRLFFSAEPPQFGKPVVIPESLTRASIQVANEAPSGLQANLRQAWAQVRPGQIELAKAKGGRDSAFKATVFALCTYHATILGRRRFGAQGWSAPYSFNMGDLNVCIDVLYNYVVTAFAKRDGAGAATGVEGGGAGGEQAGGELGVPWDDLRFVMGEIMYGGHITDFWDRRVNRTYLHEILAPGIFRGQELLSGFVSPKPRANGHDDYATVVEENLPAEGPGLYGLHGNAEMSYLTAEASTLCRTLSRLITPGEILDGTRVADGDIGGGGGGGDDAAAAVDLAGDQGAADGGGGGNVAGGGGGGGGKGGGGDKDTEAGRKRKAARKAMETVKAQVPERFNMETLTAQVEAAGQLAATNPQAPYVACMLQECRRLNVLVTEIKRSLKELAMGLDGTLNMSEAMEQLRDALLANIVPGRDPSDRTSWDRLAWPSTENLSHWLDSLQARAEQLISWSSNGELPYCVHLPSLFNPTALLTAIMQVTARAKKWPLDRMTVETHVTCMTRPAQAAANAVYPPDGIFVHGLLLQGARWAHGPEDLGTNFKPTKIAGVACAGYLVDARVNELVSAMPVMYIRAVHVAPEWTSSAVGFHRHDENLYECPVYATRQRGQTYIFLAFLNPGRTAGVGGGLGTSVVPVSKWILAGTALLLQ